MKSIWKLVLAGAAVLLLAGCATTEPVAATNGRPNIIYILADDLGWTDLGCQGSKFYETPNIDRLAKQGVRLTAYRNCQNCQPTRAALMTGQYGARTGVYTVGGIDRFDWQSRPLRPAENVTKLPLDRATIAQQLKAAGYATAMFGKWHLGEDAEHHPAARGFDEAIVSDGVHFKFGTNPKTPYPEGQYLADFLTERAEDFIHRKKDGPFFLYLPHFGVHVPLQAKPEITARFKDKAAAGGHHNATYAAMIASVDESVGRVLALLDELKLADNTVVIFSSDNGGVGGYARPDGLIRDASAMKRKDDGDHGVQFSNITDNAPLRSGKGSLYEGGTRVPFIVKWPGVTPAGATCGTPAIHVDVFPTLLEIAGAPKPKQTLDGTSMVELFRKPSGTFARGPIFQHVPGYLGSGPGLWRTLPVGTITSGDWKLMEYFEDGKLELYNLRDDLGETKNLAQTNPEKAAELRAKLIAWRESVAAPMPTKNENRQPPAQPASKKQGKRKAAKP